MLGGLIIPVVAVSVMAAVWIDIQAEAIVDRPLPNGLFLFLVALLPFLGIRLLNLVLIRLSLRFRRRDAAGNPIEPPMQHRFWFIPLPIWSFLWLLIVVGFTIFGTLSPQTEVEKKQTEKTWARWLRKDGTGH